MENQISSSSHTIAAENARFMTRVYGWMTLGILMTALISYGMSENPGLIETMLQNPMQFYALIGLQLVAVLTLSFLVQRLNSLMAGLLYFAYSALTGVTLSIIFLIYTHESILSTFLLTAFSFSGLSTFGYFTKKDLGPVGSFCIMGFFGMIGFGILSLFFPSLMAMGGQIYSAIGVIVFAGLTAYDTQKIKALNIIGNEGTDEDRKEAIYGALTLYLDFIDLFLNLLRLFGKRK